MIAVESTKRQLLRKGSPMIAVASTKRQLVGMKDRDVWMEIRHYKQLRGDA